MHYIISKDDLKKEFEALKKFAFTRNAVEVAVAIVLSQAGSKVVSSIVDNVLMPIINGITSQTGDEWRKAVWHITPSISLEIGKFVGTSLDFCITAVVLYIVYVKIVKKYLPVAEEEKKDENKISLR